jgi:hypothetical protein
MDLDHELDLEIDGCSYNMAVCPKADSPIVTKMLGEKFPLIYRYVEEGSCFVTYAFTKIKQLCRGVPIPDLEALTESMHPSNGAGLSISIEQIHELSIEAIDCINRISCCSDVQERYGKVEDTTKQLKEIAETIIQGTLSNHCTGKLIDLSYNLEAVVDAVRKQLTLLPAMHVDDLKKHLRQATAELEASKKGDSWVYYKDAAMHFKRCINMILELMMHPEEKLFDEGETSRERRSRRKNEIDDVYRKLHILKEQTQFGEDNENDLRMSMLILEAKCLDLYNAVEFLDNLRSLTAMGEHEVFYTNLPIVLCGLHKLSTAELDSFKSEGIYLNARWVTIEKACADYIKSSIMKTF